MRIQHNMAAVIASRNLNIAYNRQASLAEKLSSGYRINRAADNAAGLKISEKMRGQIRGLHQASTNAQDAISFLQTADGALNEVHSILQRVRELSVQAANDTNVDADRQSIQEEVDQLLQEINRISRQTEFNTRKIFDGSLAAANGGGTSPYQTFNSVVFQIEGIVDEFSATQEASGGNGVASKYNTLAQMLDKSIVPQAVNTLLDVYSDAFGYLKDCSTGIGLKVESNSSSSTLASVTLIPGAGTVDANGNLHLPLGFKLTVNAAYLQTQDDGELTEDSRRALEGTILHEMVHAVMDEATTAGMLGIKGTTQNKSVYGFPSWFKEGMAQTAVGGYSNDNDWVNGGLGINDSTSVDQIASIVKKSSNKLASGGGGTPDYGTGYLACMYLGQLASGKGSSSSAITPQNIRAGLNKVMGKIVSGQSLDSVINEVSGGKYSNIASFQNSFGDTESATFIRDLTAKVGEGNGSLVTNDFHDTDLLPNSDATSTFLDLNPNTQIVNNKYPDDVTVMSGGTKGDSGNKPTASYVPGTSGGNATSGGTGGTSGTGGTGVTGGTGGTGVTGGIVGTTGGLMIQVGANSGQGVSLSFDEITKAKLGLTGLSVLSRHKAGDAVERTDKAINQVSTIRSRIGAYQNRLEHTISNLDNTAENLQAAESRIRDLNIAEAMVDYAKNAIVMEAAQAVLAQANQSQNGVLKLLQ